MSKAKEFLKTDIKISGIKELARFCDQLPKKVLKKALKMAVNAGATPIARTARKLAPKLTGTLRKSIKKVVRTYPQGNSIAIIGADRAVTSPKTNPSALKKTGLNIPAKYIHLVEYGVSPHKQPLHRRFKNTGHPGFTGRHFLETALDRHRESTKKIMEDKMLEVLMKEARKIADLGYKK